MKCYVVDAFAEKIFEGNPAGVVDVADLFLEGADGGRAL
jgi:predicted PhzF superfamily epimerase YddE/YHI9